MDSETKAWIIFGLLGILMAVGPVTACTIHNTVALTRMVKAGADPQKASCAVRGTERNCLIANGK